MPQYSVNQYSIGTIISDIKNGNIAIPEIQRPFVWNSVQVRDLMDSLYNGFPVGYITAWRNPDIRLKNGNISTGKRILIDGQQRITAIQAAIVGHEIVDNKYKKKRIIISFNPLEEEFEVFNKAIERDSKWIPDISKILDDGFSSRRFINEYSQNNQILDNETEDKIENSLQKLRDIKTINIGFIELSDELGIDDVTEIFIRINSKGVVLSSADFAMSKIASDEKYNGNETRKIIDYFCHLLHAPADYETIKENDKDFSNSEAMKKIKWATKNTQNIYIPSYEDLMRVSFTHIFQRGKIADLVSLLSGRDFEKQKNFEYIAEDSFNKLREGVEAFINQTNFENFIMIVKTIGLIDKSLVRSQNVLNFAYALYLLLKKQGVKSDTIEKAVRKWLMLSILTGRYSNSPESMFEYDIKRFAEHEPVQYIQSIEEGELSDAFWNTVLVQRLDVSSANSPYFPVYVMAQIKNNARGFLSEHITVKSMIEQHGDKHHLFPKEYLKKNGLNATKDYNQVANFAYTQSEINIAIKDKAPRVYMADVKKQVNGGPKIYGGISTEADLIKNLRENCIPEEFINMDVSYYQKFLEVRRVLMAHYIRDFYKSL